MNHREFRRALRDGRFNDFRLDRFRAVLWVLRHGPKWRRLQVLCLLFVLPWLFAYAVSQYAADPRILLGCFAGVLLALIPGTVAFFADWAWRAAFLTALITRQPDHQMIVIALTPGFAVFTINNVTGPIVWLRARRYEKEYNQAVDTKLIRFCPRTPDAVGKAK